MSALVAALLLAQAYPADCRRVRSDPELQKCEIERTEHDILNSGKRPPAAALGRDVIRFSMQPSLGGRGVIVELVRAGAGARGRILWFYGHPYSGWEPEGSADFSLSARRYAELAAEVDRILASYRTLDGDAMFVCTDGPEQVTERVREGHVVSLAGFCGTVDEVPHPNRRIAALMLSLACPSMLADDPDDRQLRRNCVRWRAAARRERALVR